MNDQEPHEDHVLKRYESAIGYYRNASRYNAQRYKQTRKIVVALGATVTLVASLASASFIEGRPILDTCFAIMSPLLAATLTIASGFAQSFQWGATWRDMAVNAQKLEAERDRILTLKSEKRDPASELARLNDLVIQETQTFFQRILGGSKEAKETALPTDGGTPGRSVSSG